MQRLLAAVTVLVRDAPSVHNSVSRESSGHRGGAVSPAAAAMVGIMSTCSVSADVTSPRGKDGPDCERMGKVTPGTLIMKGARVAASNNVHLAHIDCWEMCQPWSDTITTTVLFSSPRARTASSTCVGAPLESLYAAETLTHTTTTLGYITYPV